MLSLKFSKVIILSKQIGIQLVRFSWYILSCGFLFSEFWKHALFFSLESIKLRSKFFVELPFVSQIFLKISIDHIFDRTDLIQLSLEVVSQTFLVSELTGDVALFVSGLLQLREHQIQSLHKALLVLLKHDYLVLILLMSLVKLPIVLQILPILLDHSEPIPKPVGLVSKVIDPILIYTKVRINSNVLTHFFLI